MFAELTAAVAEGAEQGHGTFQEILPYALLGSLVVMAIHLMIAFSRRRGGQPRPRWNWWERLVYLAVLASVAVLGVTAFYAVLAQGALGGWMLFVHMFGAGLFTVILPLLALTWCEANACSTSRDQADADPAARFLGLSKAMFWVILAAGVIVAGTMLLSMLPVFGTHGMEVLLDIHRWSGLVVVVATLLHLYSALLTRLRIA